MCGRSNSDTGCKTPLRPVCRGVFLSAGFSVCGIDKIPPVRYTETDSTERGRRKCPSGQAGRWCWKNRPRSISRRRRATLEPGGAGHCHSDTAGKMRGAHSGSRHAPGRLAGSRCGQPAGSRDPAGRGCDEASGGLPAGTDAGSYSGPRRGCTDPPGRGGGLPPPWRRTRWVPPWRSRRRTPPKPSCGSGPRGRKKYLTGRFSPGYGDWPITVQPKVAAVLDTARRAGICVLNTNLMTPRKSVTAILGLSDHPVKGHLAGCGHCVLRTRCEYRKRGKTCASE